VTALPRPGDPRFAHASEAEFARILDFYAVRWAYEPHTYPIRWSLDGAVLESFAPDFYLPDLDVYVELTTLRQKLVRKKNRKLRRLRECYPDLRVKLFYARDFRALMLKYGRIALADALSGTIGQVGQPAGPETPAGPSVEPPTADRTRRRPAAPAAAAPVTPARPRRTREAAPR
jgi:hypoxanthine phosphoribosyltransferase